MFFGIECIHAEQSDVKQKMITLGIKLMLEKKNQLRSNSVIYQNNSISDIYIAVWIVFLLTVLSELYAINLEYQLSAELWHSILIHLCIIIMVIINSDIKIP